VFESSDPDGPEHLTAVPTIIRAGEAFNVVPDAGELICDLRADSLPALESVLTGLPAESDGVRLRAAMVRAWPGMDTREATRPLLAAASKRLGRPVAASERGGASDASHMAARIPLTVDGFGPRGGGAHTPDEWISASSLHSRAEVALAVVTALLGGGVNAV
jgi:glutamate carboxypeptidase